MKLTATYRLQLGPGQGFPEARRLVPYLRDLGISHLYLSPSLQARAGSTHGYDVVDPTRLSDELGGEEAFLELAAAGLGIVLDIVPNHMAACDENRYWVDADERARFFDIDPETGRHRRFFTIDDLAGVRVEDDEVFEATHAKVLQLVRDGLVDGLRIDHPDGLADPAGYLERLAARAVGHVWVEKILEPGERLRDWPVEGTTGYEFANDATALFVDPAAEERLTSLYRELTGEGRSFAAVAHEAKLEQTRADFRPEFERLRRLYDDSRLEEAAASLRVYRTYVRPGGPASDEDRAQLAHLPPDLRERLLEGDELTVRFQQTTGAVMAKGVEDTAFYRYFRLSALNEVGGDPDRFSLPVDEFHGANLERAERFPRHLLTTQTHDTKRSGDVRARIVALTWLPDEWEALARAKVGAFADANEGYLALQTVVGAWPLSRERLADYLRKALREGKRTSGWARPDEAHEAEVSAAASELLEDAEVEAFALHVAELGRRIAAGMTLLKLTVPGVPDIYQGDELESLSLVDPDNRRPVDWERRQRLLGEGRRGSAPTAETAKLALIARALELRRRRPEAFEGAYEPVDAGPDVCAFLRGGDVMVVVPVRREVARAVVELPAGRWRDVVTGAERDAAEGVAAADLVSDLGVALLERVSVAARNTVCMAEGWTPEAWGDREPAQAPARLPRVEDLPVAEQGYEREAVQEAFESFYRHAAQLDATLRVVESMEVFARQAGDLRADIRALRAASWGPLPAVRPAWTPRERERGYARAGPGGLAAAAPRLALEAAFIVVVAVGAALADLPAAAIVLLVLVSWLIVGAAEFVATSRRATVRPGILPRPTVAASEESGTSEATMIEAPPAEVAEREEQAVEEEPAVEAVEEAEEPEEEPADEEPAEEAQPEPVAEAELEEAPADALEDAEPEPAVAAAALAEQTEEPTRRRWFRRRTREPELAPEPMAQSRHVRVLGAGEAPAPAEAPVLDAWEQAAELPDVPEVEAEEPEEPDDARAVGEDTLESIAVEPAEAEAEPEDVEPEPEPAPGEPEPEEPPRAVGEDTMESPPVPALEPAPEAEPEPELRPPRRWFGRRPPLLPPPEPIDAEALALAEGADEPEYGWEREPDEKLVLDEAELEPVLDEAALEPEPDELDPEPEPPPVGVPEDEAEREEEPVALPEVAARFERSHLRSRRGRR